MESGLHITLASERLGSFFGLPITNTLITAWVVTAILLITALVVRKNLRLVPGRAQSAVEMFFEYLLGLMEQTLGSRRLAERFFPLIATIFLFILTANMFDFLPIIGSIVAHHGGETVPLLHPVNSDINMPLALAIISFLVIEISGIVTLGFFRYAGKFVNVREGLVGFLVGLVELIGNLARLVSLSFRLFGAIFAGEVLLLVIGTYVPYGVPVPLMAFEAFIGLLQAAVFAILTMAFIKIAMMEPHAPAAKEHAHAH